MSSLRETELTDEELKKLYEAYREQLGSEERPPEWKDLTETDKTYFRSARMVDNMRWVTKGRPVGMQS